jgi:prepilin-type N-terminal cleavage/methylation domain-containing protein
MNRRGVTLIEMLIVVAIIGTIVSISFPSLAAGLAGIRLSSASGSVASFLTSAMNNVERREQPAAIVVDPEHNVLDVYTSDSGSKPREQLGMPQGISIEGEKLRRFMLFPGGAFPRISIVLKSDRGAHKSIEIDPITAVPNIK